ncbi:fungal-specific transcription factor domain-containing protein [Mycena crocata]|nr:fungal-specific transcription factor domain-containing protein [Mycena crocata]
MSSDAENGQEIPPTKKRRLHRACDACRRRKSRCDGSRLIGEACSACVDAELECTYNDVVAVPIRSTVESLQEAEAVIRELRATVKSATGGTLSHDSINGGNTINPGAKGTTNLMDGQSAMLSLMRTTLKTLCEVTPPLSGHAEDPGIENKMETLSIGCPFIGKSSGVVLIKAVTDLKEEVHRAESVEPPSPPNFTAQVPVASSKNGYQKNFPGPDEEFRPWPNTSFNTPAHTFPPPEIITALIDLYFTRVNILLPLLHRPTFERAVEEGLHARNDGFAATVLLVCALASRWSDDPCMRESGWGWFNQVPPRGNNLLGEATLYDLQYCCLAAQFLACAWTGKACWTLIGVGLRLAQDVGAHRRTPGAQKPSVERELWKRAFWVLVYMDRMISSSTGRACAIQHEDFDLEPLIEADDEYWEDPMRPFQQPVGVPSRIAFFNCLLRLSHILAFGLKIIYPLVKSTHGCDEQVVAEFDSALNRWHDEVPEHLRWDPACADPVFFEQSATLYCQYSHLQVLIHRPFIPTMRTSATTALPSLAICTAAARTCASVVDVHRRRTAQPLPWINVHTVFTAGLILILNVWSGKRTGRVTNSSREIANVHKCLEVLQVCVGRWRCARFLWETLHELASVGQVPAPAPEVSERYSNGQQLAATHIRAPGNPKLSAPEMNVRYIPEAAPYTLEAHGADVRAVPSTFEGSLIDTHPQFSAFGTSTPLRGTASQSSHINPAAHNDEFNDLMGLLDSDTMAMWANAPTGFQEGDWEHYLSDFSGIMQMQQ